MGLESELVEEASSAFELLRSEVCQSGSEEAERAFDKFEPWFFQLMDVARGWDK